MTIRYTPAFGTVAIAAVLLLLTEKTAQAQTTSGCPL